ncbi:sensor domain-containing protein [Alkalihalobacterium elongatum]|uniref:sensor domain-containing protein n=1 Tax=Alkalihalobacterium elongatum TaxID=2675466 RepID=UPI001C1FB61D|nr:EAL domain-containing protein [Alkalihalobacterium elongatum]
MKSEVQSIGELELCKRIEELEKREAELLLQLRMEEKLNAKILDALPINIFLEDAAGRTVFANKQACDCNGLTSKELVGKTVFDFFTKPVAEKVRQDDLHVWETKQLLTKEILADFQGQESYVYTGKTIISLDDVSKKEFLLGFALDITDRVKAEKKLKESEELFQKLVDQAADSFFLSDSTGRIIDVNTAACEKLGYCREDLLTLSIEDIVDLPAERLADVYNIVNRSKTYSYEHGILRKGGSSFPAETNVGLIRVGDRVLYLGLSRDISDRKKVEEQIKHMAYHDSLTGLPNRWYIYSYIKRYLTRKRSKDNKLAILLLDLDHFKVINDSLGHQAGDLLLQYVAERLQRSLSKTDILARLGGDEFIIALPNIKEESKIRLVCEKIIDAMEQPFDIEGQSFKVSTSIGISISPDHGEEIHTLIQNADIAMYRSKEAGRDGFCVFDNVMKESAKKRMELEISLRQALEHNEFTLYYQPKIDLKTGNIYGMEALIRWQRGDGNLVSPSSFIELAEETGLIVPIGEWVIREACKQCKIWHEAGYPLTVSVNLSAQQFQKQSIKSVIARAIKDSELCPEALELELTETTVMKAPKQATVILEQLKDLGVTISIDDFGTGFSSLSYLNQFPIDTLKIDRSFIFDSDKNEANQEIASAIITLAHSLGLCVVAEGVENEKQLNFLKSKQCDAVQGYYISEPMGEAEVLAFLKESSEI